MRQMGPRWLATRAYQEAKTKLRIMQRRLPLENWDQRPLASWLHVRIPSEPSEYVHWRETGAGKFFFGRLPQADLLSSVSNHGAVSQADALLTGRWIYFGMLPVEAGFPPNWHCNPLTGDSAPADRHWAEIPDFAFGDIKLIWEASRFTPVYALVRAYAVTRNEQYPDAFWELVEDWALHNPPQLGPNWKCGQEASFRVMAWCFGLYGFLASRHTTPTRVAALSKMIAATAERIEANIGSALLQNNNHGVSEAMGLFTAGTLFPEFRRAELWRNQGRKLLERQSQTQIYADGAYVQHSMNYQRVMLQGYAWALRLAELNGEPFSSDVYVQLRRSSDFLDGMIDAQSGQVPNYGNNDGTHVLPLTDCDYCDFRPTLQVMHYLDTKQRRLAKGIWDEALVWLFSEESLNGQLKSTLIKPSIESHNGYYLLRGPESWAMIRCAKYHDRPGHADQLHMDLWWRGLNVALDSGTYLYNPPPPWHVAFVTSAVHNTVTVDGKDQMRRFSRFLWLDWAQGSNLLNRRERDCELWQGEHDGYRRLCVVHRRTVERRGDTWSVIDEVLGNGHHRVRLHWLFPDLPRVIEAEAGTLKLKTPRGSVVVTARSTVATDFSLIRAGQVIVGKESRSDDITRGWVSHTYASKEPALSLVLDAEALLPIRFETRFEFVSYDSLDLQSDLRVAEVGK